nr:low molecular weight phosphatase family protein [Mycobacterium sp. BK086]
MHILFVCTGNICRSPTAERLALTYGAELGISDLTTSSAGTRAVIGHPVHPDAATVLEQLGGDASQFAARQLTAKIALNADLVLTMSKAHRDAVLELAPRQLHKTFTLVEAAKLAQDYDAERLQDLAALRGQLPARDVHDIPDPIGREPEFFAEVGANITDALRPILQICRQA